MKRHSVNEVKYPQTFIYHQAITTIMPHILAKLKGVKFEDIKNLLKEHAPQHDKEGLYLEHIWQNADDQNEVLFLFKANDLSHARQYIQQVHSQALKENPKANLPQMTFLES